MDRAGRVGRVGLGYGTECVEVGREGREGERDSGQFGSVQVGLVSE